MEIDGSRVITASDMKKSGLKIKDSRKVNLRYTCLKYIDAIIDCMYSPGAMKLMQKQGYSVEIEDIAVAKKKTKSKMVNRYLEGKTTKQLTGSLSQLKQDLDAFKF